MFRTSLCSTTLLTVLLSSSLLIAQQERGFRNIVRDPDTGTEIRAYNESWAVIIGIDKYQNAPQLDYAVADARAIGKLLTDKFGFLDKNIRILVDRDATRENILKALGNLADKTAAEDRVVVFFAGHGQTHEPEGGAPMGYLVPADGKARTFSDLSVSCIRMADLRDLTNVTRAKHMLFLVDACYGGLAAVGSRSISEHTKGYIRKVTAARARQILTAGGKGEQVIEKQEWGHSAFTYQLLEGLGRGLADEDENGVVTARELASYIDSRVSKMTENRQKPQFRSFTEDEGEFLFILPGPAKGVISISSQPVDANVLLDGQPRGRTPLRISDVNPGSHTLTLEKDGYARTSVPVNVEPDLEVTISPKLTKLSSLVITSDPAGADVYIDGKFMGKTPLEVPSLSPGQVKISITRAGYSDWQTDVDLTEGIRKEVNASLAGTFGSLSVTSNPAGAQVFANGQPIGVTPLISKRTSAGSVEVKVVKEDFAEWRTTTHIAAGKESKLDAELASTVGFLTLDVWPADAEVLLAGKSMGEGSVHGHKLPVGSYEIRVRKEDYLEHKEIVNIEPGGEKSLTVKLSSSLGLLSVYVPVPDAEVSVDGKIVGAGSVQNYRVPAGRHEVEVRHPSLSRAPSEVINVLSEKECKLEARFGVFSAIPLLRSVVVPGLGQILNGSSLKGTILLVGTIGGGAYSYLSQSDYVKKVDAYNSTVEAYKNAKIVNDAVGLRSKFTSQYSEVDQAKKARTIAFLATAGIYLVNLLDALIFESYVDELRVVALNDRIDITPTLSFSSYGAQWGVQVKF